MRYAPIYPFQQVANLRQRDHHHAVDRRRPDEAATLHLKQARSQQPCASGGARARRRSWPQKRPLSHSPAWHCAAECLHWVKTGHKLASFDHLNQQRIADRATVFAALMGFQGTIRSARNRRMSRTNISSLSTTSWKPKRRDLVRSDITSQSQPKT